MCDPPPYPLNPNLAFMAEVDVKHSDKIPAFKGSRMHWLLEAAVVFLHIPMSCLSRALIFGLLCAVDHAPIPRST